MVPKTGVNYCLTQRETILSHTFGIISSFSRLENLVTGGRRTGEALTYRRLQGGGVDNAAGISEADLYRGKLAFEYVSQIVRH